MTAARFDQALIDRIHTEEADLKAAVESRGASLFDVRLTVSADGTVKRFGEYTRDDLLSRADLHRVIGEQLMADAARLRDLAGKS